MAEPYIGEIRLFGGNFAPQGWATCDGQILSIAEYEPLFVLIGTTYGGDGQSNFALPNLAAQTPVHMGASSGTSTYALGQTGGQTSITLTSNQLPAHSHAVATTSGAQQVSPASAFFAPASSSQSGVLTYGPGTTPVGLHPSSVALAGGAQPHDNMQPYLAVTYIIALYGVYPPQN